MKSLTTSTILMLVASSLIFFFIGRFTAPTNTTGSNESFAETNKDTPKGEGTKKDNSVALNNDDGKKAEEISAAAAAKEKEAADKAAEEEAKRRRVENTTSIAAPTSLVTSNNLARVKMGISDDKITKVLSSISKNLEDKKLAYVSNLMQDCSGIFHQLKDSLQSRLPSIAEGNQYQYPSPRDARSSRQIADWYHKNNNLLIVQDPIACRNSIRPGAVLFFGKAGKTFKNINIDMLTDRDNNYTSNGAIQHIAVVTEVRKGKNDEDVISYTMMHGRRPGKTAHRSDSKEVQSPNRTLPAFGHWSQQLVGIANMATPKK